MIPSFRPLAYTWGAIFAGLAGGAGALQIIGPPPHRPSEAATLGQAAPPASPPVQTKPENIPGPSPAPLSNTEASAPAAPVSEALAPLPERDVRPQPIMADLPPALPKRNGAERERRRPVASTSPKPLPQENVWQAKPRFIGVFVTQADGTRVFKPQP